MSKTKDLEALRCQSYERQPRQLMAWTHCQAIDCYPQTNLIAEPYDRIIGATGLAGPIEAKFRYMIVVWRTDQGVAAIPLYTLAEIRSRVRQARLEEFVSVTTESDWKGDTPWAGMPLLAKFNQAYNCEPRCYADLSRPHWIGQHEAIVDDVGRILGGDYSKLMDLLAKKEREFRTAAFARYDTNGPQGDQPELYEPWTPTKPHQPERGKRYQDDKTRRMDLKRFPRV
ncbi:hypothetical protein E4T50_14065 [Aureobasidium sp. EXF-12298]|nr:hypothetical protein E4T50_14065 [Aureobasidium sp. EXF-12298]